MPHRNILRGISRVLWASAAVPPIVGLLAWGRDEALMMLAPSAFIAFAAWRLQVRARWIDEIHSRPVWSPRN